MRLPGVVAALVALACLIPAFAVVLAVVVWEDRTALATAGAVLFLVVSALVAVVVARRFQQPAGREGPVDV